MPLLEHLTHGIRISDDMSRRVVEPDLLESLAPDHPDAIQNRAELRLVNAIMGNHRWLARQARHQMTPGARILELGAGDGTLGQRLVGKGVCDDEKLCGIDIVPRPAHWPEKSAWIQGDLLRLSPLPEAEIIVASLILHHFWEPTIHQLGQRLPASCRALIAVEPARYRMHSIQGRIFSAIMRLHQVTRHDMHTSIRGGFRGDELADALGLEGWQCRSTHTAFGACRFIATR